VLALYGLMLHSLDYEKDRELRKIILTPGVAEWYSVTPGLKEAVQRYVQGIELELTDLGKGLRVLVDKLVRSPDIASVHTEMVKAFGLYFRTASEGAFQRLERLSIALKQPWISAFFTKEIGSQGPVVKALETLVKRVTGKKGESLTPQESNTLKENNPALWKEYNRLRREYNQIWKDAISSFVRSSGKHLVPLKDVERFLATKGINATYPKGFTGLIDAEGKWYTSDGKLINGIPAGVIFGEVRMNPRYQDGSKEGVFQAIRKDGTPGGYFYTVEQLRQSTQKKFENVRDLSNKIESIRKRWIALIRNFDEEQPNTVCGVILELAFQFSARIGSVGNKFEGKATFGLSTVQLKHYYPQSDGGFVLRYPGKIGVKTIHKLRPTDVLNRTLARIVAELSKDKKPSDPLFTYKMANGTRKRVQASRVNQVFKALGAGNVTIHKIRTYAATKLFRELMNELFQKKPSFSDPKAAMAAFLKMAEMAGRMLNHVRKTSEGGTAFTAATALGSYIDVEAQVQFFQHYQLALPKYLEKLVNKPEEAAYVPTSDEADRDEDIDVEDIGYDGDDAGPEAVEVEDILNEYVGVDPLDPEWNPSMMRPDNLLVG